LIKKLIRESDKKKTPPLVDRSGATEKRKKEN
jgi:hypothetical protein